ncbi:30S ribosomal protein S6 [Candidatus Pacearchaeota archaeon]|nr:MAG: 30S ribosomal protein S6 [Candidatus Pacearchaeota archaeon]
MRKYEMMVIFRPDLGEDGLRESMEKIKEFIEKGGGVVEEMNDRYPWGRRELAYEIKKFKEGYYVIYNFSLENVNYLEELKNFLRLNNDLLRWMILRR